MGRHTKRLNRPREEDSPETDQGTYINSACHKSWPLKIVGAKRDIFQNGAGTNEQIFGFTTYLTARINSKWVRHLTVKKNN